MKILLNILTHGDETVGLKVAKEIGKLELQKGEILVHVANVEAYKKRKRFIDQDLNRSFPGLNGGNFEQDLAYKINEIVKSFDIVIDIHSTTSDLKDALIITKINSATKKYIEVMNPKYVLFMRQSKTSALISSAKVGIAFEYGKNNDKLALDKTVDAIKKLLVFLGMVDGEVKGVKYKTIWMDVFGSEPKPKGSKLLPAIKNYKIVKKGARFAVCKNDFITAEEDFYPVLFGEKSYKDVFGFKARLLK